MNREHPVLLADLTWPAIAALVEGGEELCLLPVGAIEQHGRHLPVSTDADIATAICRAASSRTGAPVLPTFEVGSSQAHTDVWPGTLSLPPRLLVEVVCELTRWIRASGFRKLLIVNGHVGNTAPLKVAVDEVRHAGTLRVGLVNWYDLTPQLAENVRSDAEDWHAHAAETSLMLHLRPELVDIGQIHDDPDRTGELVFSYTVAETSEAGLTGAPSRATAEDGAPLFAAAVSALAERIERGRREEPPLDRHA
jgi:creatinine amidohydrolase